MAEAQEVTYYVRQNCDGCTRSVGKLLQKAKGKSNLPPPPKNCDSTPPPKFPVS